jgi:hypothetical protein
MVGSGALICKDIDMTRCTLADQIKAHRYEHATGMEPTPPRGGRVSASRLFMTNRPRGAPPRACAAPGPSPAAPHAHGRDTRRCACAPTRAGKRLLRSARPMRLEVRARLLANHAPELSSSTTITLPAASK